MLTSNKRLGLHVGLGPTLLETMTVHPSMFTLQMCWGNAWDVKKFSSDDLMNTKSHCLMYDRNFYVHASCRVHLGTVSLPAIAHVQGILNQLSDVPGSAIVHIGKGKDSSLEKVKQSLNQLKIPEGSGRTKHKLLLENAAGQGFEKGRDWNELFQLFEGLDPKIGLCIDTQHSFASGLCNFSDPNAVQEFFKICDTYFPGRLQAIHLNDSGTIFKSQIDSHGNTYLRNGYIWKDNDLALKLLLQESYKRELDCILETGGGYNDLALLHKEYLNV